MKNVTRNAPKRMLVICPFPQGVAAGQRLKYEQYFDDWREGGWDITVSSFMDRAMWDIVYKPGNLIGKTFGVLRGHLRRMRDMLRIHRYDLVYVFMYVTPAGTSLFERWTRVQANTLVYDVEDNILLMTPPAHSFAARLFRRLANRRRKSAFLIRHADAVIVASPFLVESYEKYNRRSNVHCIPPSLDTDRIKPKAPGQPVNSPPVIGWTGTFSSRIYLDLMADILQRLASRVSFRMRVIGNFEYELPGVDLDVVQWSEANEAADLQSLDIGIYPLIDDEWTRGKAGLKIIQYQAAGVPCVASDVPLSRLQMQDGVDGYLAKSPEDWGEILERLLLDPGLRSSIGKAGRATAVGSYSRQIAGQRYRDVLHGLTEPCSRLETSARSTAVE